MKRVHYHSVKGFILLTLLFLAMSFDTAVREARVMIAPDSELVISGSTNVNKFHCRYSVAELDAPLRVSYEVGDNRYFFRDTRLKLANSCFDCGGRAINRDFQELLKTDLYPNVQLKLLYVEKPENDLDPLKVGVEVTLAGEARTFETLVVCDRSGSLCIEGYLDVCFSDFDLEPPTKVMGIIKVSDQLTVSLKLKILNVQPQS